MHGDISQAWIDHDQLLAAGLKQHPDSSSFDLADYLVAETGLHWPTAMRIVEDYIFRKAHDMSQADWEVERPILLQLSQVPLALATAIGMCHLLPLFLSPSMLSVLYSSVLVLSFVVILLMIARGRLATLGKGVPDLQPGEKHAKFP